MHRNLETVLFPGWWNAGKDTLKLHYGTIKIFPTHLKILWPSSNFETPTSYHRNKEWLYLRTHWLDFCELMSQIYLVFFKRSQQESQEISTRDSPIAWVIDFMIFKYTIHLFLLALNLANTHLFQKFSFPGEMF